MTLQHILKYETIESFTPSKENNYELKLFKTNVKCNYFVLIISGSAEVMIGKENFKYTAHEFSYFGLPAILAENETKKELMNEQNVKHDLNYVPDYSVTIRESCIYMKLTRQAYIKAVRNEKALVNSNSNLETDTTSQKPELFKSNVKRLSLKKIDNKKILKKNLSVQNFQV